MCSRRGGDWWGWGERRVSGGEQRVLRRLAVAVAPRLPSARTGCILLFAGGTAAVAVSARLATSASAFLTFVVPTVVGGMAGLLLPAFFDGDLSADGGRPDWLERIRVTIYLLAISAPLYRFIRPHLVPSTWFALVGGALMVGSLFALHERFKASVFPLRSPTASQALGDASEPVAGAVGTIPGQ